jgi:hypothetical protein
MAYTDDVFAPYSPQKWEFIHVLSTSVYLPRQSMKHSRGFGSFGNWKSLLPLESESSRGQCDIVYLARQDEAREYTHILLKILDELFPGGKNSKVAPASSGKFA